MAAVCQLVYVPCAQHTWAAEWLLKPNAQAYASGMTAAPYAISRLNVPSACTGTQQRCLRKGFLAVAITVSCASHYQQL